VTLRDAAFSEVLYTRPSRDTSYKLPTRGVTASRPAEFRQQYARAREGFATSTRARVSLSQVALRLVGVARYGIGTVFRAIAVLEAIPLRCSRRAAGEPGGQRRLGESRLTGA
jgi:hypothetical protein